MVEILNQNDLRKWLDNKGWWVASALASRATLRVLPLIESAVPTFNTGDGDRLALLVLRAVSTSWFFSFDNTPDISQAATDVAKATNTILTGSNAVTDAVINVAKAVAHGAEHEDACFGDVAYGTNYVVVATNAATAAAADAARAASIIWPEISADARAWETHQSTAIVITRPFWTDDPPERILSHWMSLKRALLSRDDDWQVWIDWYEDRLRGANDKDSRPVIKKLERERILIPDKTWKQGPKVVNALIADLEQKYRAAVPAQIPAIIEVEYGEDGRLHRRHHPPQARNEAQRDRLEAGWAALEAQLEGLEDLTSGKFDQHFPGFSRMLAAYREALGANFQGLNVIALGMYGQSLTAYAARADERLLEGHAANLAGLAAAHGLFINQFDGWQEYLADTRPDPSPEMLDALSGVAEAAREDDSFIAEDVSEPLADLAAQAKELTDAAPEDEPARNARRELLRSVGNVLSGMYAPLLDFARDGGKAARKGALKGIETGTADITALMIKAITIGSSAAVIKLAAGMAASFGWIALAVTLLRSKTERPAKTDEPPKDPPTYKA